jgi:probable F420-dependent oxidoreductase
MSVLTGTGIWSRELRQSGDEGERREAAAELEELGYSALWFPGGQGGRVFDHADLLLGATSRVTVLSGILNVWRHPPEETSAGHARLRGAHDGRWILGAGIGHPSAVEEYRKPLTKMRAYLAEIDVPRDERVIAALGPKMLDLAREETLGAHPYFVPVEHTAIARERLGPEPLLAPEQAVVLETDVDRARELARGHMANYLELPNYTNNILRVGGFGEDDLRDGGSDRLVDAIVAWGDEGAIRARLDAHRAAGADHVCIQVIHGRGADLPLPEWRALASALLP